ncbi:MAG: ATP-binding protein, partial [Gemmatimonadota bacterium]
IGLLLLPFSPRRDYKPARVVLDMVVVAACVGVVIWMILGLTGAGDGVTPFERGMSFAYPIAALLGVIAADQTLARGRPASGKRGFRLIAGTLALAMITDLLFSLLWSAGYTGLNWAVAPSALADVGMMWGAWFYRIDPITESGEATRRPLVFNPLPLLAVTGLAALVFWAIEHKISLPLQPVMLSLVGLMLLLVMREAMTVRDVAEHLAQTVLHAQERRFASLVRHSSDVLLVLDPSHRVVFASPSADGSLGTAPGSLLGLRLVDLAHPADAGPVQEALDRLQLNPGGSATFSWRGRSGESPVSFETAATNLLDEPGVGGLVLNSRDTTERLRLEEQLRHVQKMDAIGRLAGGVAHDFNNLLTAILGGTELALLELDDDHPAAKDLAQVRNAASRGAALVGRLLALSRREVTTPRVVSVPRLVADSLPLVESLLGRQITFTHRISPDAGHTLIDPMDLEHCLLNLAANARDAMPDGGTFTITVDLVELTGPLESAILPPPPGRHVRLIATDDGEGIDPATLSRMFEPFFTTKGRGRGTGLGLASLFVTIERAGGGIAVSSEPGRGTTVALYLPMVEEEEAPRPIRGGSADHPGTILLVDDDPGVRQAATRILETQGHLVLSAGDAREAFELASRHPIAVLLTDVMMPGESGPRLAARLLAAQPGLQVLFMSGYAGDELADAGIKPDQVELLRKPFTVEELTRRVREALARSG